MSALSRALLLSLGAALVLGGAPPGAGLTSIEAASRSVVKVRARDCASGDRNGTGFVWGRADQVVTALHVVAGCRRVEAWYEAGGGLTRTLHLTRIHLHSDLAILRVEDPPEVEPLVARTHEPAANTRLLALGFPLDAPRISDQELRVQVRPSGRLRDLLSSPLRQELENAGSPSVELEIVRLDGHLLPGMSGAPILDAEGTVVAVGDGGLEGGTVSISWAIPSRYLRAAVASGDSPSSRLGRSQMHFQADFDSEVTGRVRCGELELVRLRTRSLDEMERYSDDVGGLRQLAAGLEFPRWNFEYDIWSHLESGGTVAVPSSLAVEEQQGYCSVEDPATGLLLWISTAHVRTGTDVPRTADDFERLILKPQYAWRFDPEWSYHHPIERPDGLLLRRKRWLGEPQPPPGPTVASVHETIATRHPAFLGSAAIDVITNAWMLDRWNSCQSLPGPTPECDQLFEHFRMRAQMVLAVHLTTFPWQ